MDKFIIYGPSILKGSVDVSGSKNETLQILCATLLTRNKITLYNVPKIKDVNIMLNILKYIGVKIEYDLYDKNKLILQAKNIDSKLLKENKICKYISSIRGSFMLVGPLLNRFNEIYISHPGGDSIGDRNLNVHIDAFNKLGVTIKYNYINKNYCIKYNNKIHENKIILTEPSVTATANIIMFSVISNTSIEIYNAACEPYIQKLCLFLNNMGGKIYGIKSNLLFIKGVKELHGTCHIISSDIIEVGTWISLGLVNTSNFKISNIIVDENIIHIINFFNRFFEINISYSKNEIYIVSNDIYKIKNMYKLNILEIYDSPWPGIPSDLLNILSLPFLKTNSCVLVHNKMFDRRLHFINYLIVMGVNVILCDSRRVIINGLNKNNQLIGNKKIYINDIRTGMALVIVSLLSKGISVLYNIEQIYRGYENIYTKLLKLGAKIYKED